LVCVKQERKRISGVKGGGNGGRGPNRPWQKGENRSGPKVKKKKKNTSLGGKNTGGRSREPCTRESASRTFAREKKKRRIEIRRESVDKRKPLSLFVEEKKPFIAREKGAALKKKSDSLERHLSEIHRKGGPPHQRRGKRDKTLERKNCNKFCVPLRGGKGGGK